MPPFHPQWCSMEPLPLLITAIFYGYGKGKHNTACGVGQHAFNIRMLKGACSFLLLYVLVPPHGICTWLAAQSNR